MVLKGWNKQIVQWINKYKYVALVLSVGIVLMLWPAKKDSAEIVTAPKTEQSESVDEQLEKILSTIDGAGQTKVLLTYRAGEETVYQVDTDTVSGETDMSSQIKTVIINTGDREETGLVRQVNPPVFLGAIVVCEGADSPSVKLAVVDAVSKAIGLGADQISVLKMK